MLKILILFLFPIFLFSKSPSLLDESIDSFYLYSQVFTINYYWTRAWADNPSFDKWKYAINHTLIDDNKLPGNTFLINWVVHPIFGYYCFLYYLNMGYSKQYAFLGTLFQTSSFEFFTESWYGIPPSYNDIMIGTVLGSFLALGSYDILLVIKRYNKIEYKILSYILNPGQIFLNSSTFTYIIPTNRGIYSGLILTF